MEITKIINNKEGKPLEFYLEKFQAGNPEEMAERCALPWEAGHFTFPLLGSTYQITHPGFAVSGTPEASNPEKILFLRYLLDGKAAAAGGRFLAYQEFPWGEVYLRQFTDRCIRRFAFTYGKQPARLQVAMARLPAYPIGQSDAGYDLTFMPGLTIRFLLWLGDEEFPPSAQILFSDNFLFAFTAEDLANIGDIVLKRIKLLL